MIPKLLLFCDFEDVLLLSLDQLFLEFLRMRTCYLSFRNVHVRVQCFFLVYPGSGLCLNIALRSSVSIKKLINDSEITTS